MLDLSRLISCQHTHLQIPQHIPASLLLCQMSKLQQACPLQQRVHSQGHCLQVLHHDGSISREKGVQECRVQGTPTCNASLAAQAGLPPFCVLAMAVSKWHVAALQDLSQEG